MIELIKHGLVFGMSFEWSNMNIAEMNEMGKFLRDR